MIPARCVWVSRPNTVLLLLCLLVPITTQLSCSEGDGIIIDITSLSVPENTTSLQINATHNGMAYPTSQRIQHDFAHFWVSLPLLSNEELVLDVSALDSRQCTLADAKIKVQLTTEQKYFVTMLLAPRATPSCTLVVEKFGPGVGRVTSDLMMDGQPSIDCPGRCSISSLESGTRITLSATIDPPWYFGGWVGACSGRRECAITIDGTRSTQVIYTAISPPICSRDDWCWDNPKPTKLTVRDASIGDVYEDSIAVGDHGLVLSMQAGQWSAVPRFTDENILAYNQGSREYCFDSYVVGTSGMVFHCQQGQWKHAISGTTSTLYSVQSPFAVGAGGTIISCANGGSNYVCAQVASGTTNTLRKIRGTTIVGDNGTILTTSGFTPIPSGTTKNLYDVFDIGSDSWIVGQDGIMLRKQGGIWTGVPSVTSSTLYSLSGIIGLSNTELWAAGENGTILRWDGVQWKNIPSGTTQTIRKIAKAHSSLRLLKDAWAFGDNGLILHWDGAVWAPAQQDTPDPTTGKTLAAQDLSAIWGSGVNDVWVLSRAGTVLHWNGLQWAAVELPVPASPRAGWASAADDVWLVGSTALRWDGATWQQLALPTPDCDGLNAIWGAEKNNNIWVYGCGTQIFRWDGRGWQPEGKLAVSSRSAPRLFGKDKDNVWLSTGDLYYRTGNGWKSFGVLQYPPPFLNGAPRPGWTFGGDDVWVTDGYDTLYHKVSFFNNVTMKQEVAWPSYKGSNFLQMPSLWGTSAHRLWGVGQGGNIRHWNGSSWYAVDSGISALDDTFNLTAVWGAGPEDIWAVGLQGVILRYRP